MKIKGLGAVIAAFFVMLCLGSIYNWSIFSPELKSEYSLSSSESTLIFGAILIFFTTTTIFTGRIQKKVGAKVLGIISGLFFAGGYALSSISEGNFILLLLGIGVLGGIGTGIGYLISLTVPIKWFPEKKGLVTGIVSGGFGGGAIVMSAFTEHLFKKGTDVLDVFLITGLMLGAIIIVFSFFYAEVEDDSTASVKLDLRATLNKKFLILFIAMFGGTFSGLLVIGNLKSIGLSFEVDAAWLIYAIAVFSVANFSGRLFWGWLSDKVIPYKLIPISLILLGISTFLIGSIEFSGLVFLIFTFIVGFGFGANFVLFAKETVQQYGIENYGLIYPLIFQGYGLAGIFGPLTGGVMYDNTQSYSLSVVVALIICILVSIPFFFKRKVA